MKKIFLLLFILFFGKAFSQTDSSFKTDNVFLITYIDFNNKLQKFEDVRLTNIDSISLSFEEIIYGRTSNENKYVSKKIIFDRIQNFGYRTSMSIGSRAGIGALVGFGSMMIFGAIAGGGGSFTGDGSLSTANKVGYIVLFSIAAAIPAALIGSLTGIGQQQYEVLDISKYNRAKKFKILKRLIKNGVKEND